MSSQTIEVEIDETGKVRSVDPLVAVPPGPALLMPLRSSRPTSGAPSGNRDWHDLIGTLRDSPNWRGEPQAIQDRLRDEWR